MQLPVVGDIFLDRYELREVLGRGGFGTVFEAWDSRNLRRVVIKVLSPGREGYRPSMVVRFKRESSIFATFKSPYIVTMFDHGTAPNGLLYIVFEHVDGRDLKRIIAEQGPLDEKVTLRVLSQLLDALAEAHDQGILHRDIKPENVLVYEYGGDPWRVKLIDFGLAKDTAEDDNRLTQTGTVMGTMRYMPPEQLRGGRLGPESDLFSVGLVVYEMRTGKPFIEGDGPDEWMKAHATARSIPLQALFENRVAGEAINRLGIRDRGRRAGSARSVIAGMQGRAPEVDRGSMSQPMPIRKPPPEPAKGSRKGLMMAGGLAFLVFCLVGAMLLAYRSRQRDAAPVVVKPEVLDARPNLLAPQPAPAIVEPTEPEPPPEEPEVPAKPARCEAVEEHGWRQLIMDDGLGEVPVAFYLPRSFAGTEPTPMVLVTSSYGGKTGSMLASSGLMDVSEEKGFLVMLLGTTRPSILDAALELANENLCVDTRRVFTVNYAPHLANTMSRTKIPDCHPWIVGSAEIVSYYSMLYDAKPEDDGCGRPVLRMAGMSTLPRDENCPELLKATPDPEKCRVTDCTRPSFYCQDGDGSIEGRMRSGGTTMNVDHWQGVYGFFEMVGAALEKMGR